MTKHPTPAGHEIALGTTAWRLWRDACLRSAGFPARRELVLCDDDLADAADDHARSPGAGAAYAAAYRAATGRLPRITADVAGDSLFREAVSWQNPALAATCLDRITAETPRKAKSRARELAIASYLQRYCLKNDTIGFFGPVGWASLTAADDGIAVSVGERLLAQRNTYFEAWAIDQVARVIAERDEVFCWLRPRRDPSVLLVGHRLHRPRRKPVTLSAAQVRMLAQ